MPKRMFFYTFAACLAALAALVVFTASCGPLAAGIQPIEDTETFTLRASAQEQAPSKFDACKLMTKADAEQILGEAVDSPTNPLHGTETYSVDSCQYQVKGGTALDNATLIVTVPANGDPARARAVFNSGEQQAQALYNAAAVDVPGIGDSAFWVGGSGNNLTILKGNIDISLSASTQKGDSASQALLDLAKVVLGRLP